MPSTTPVFTEESLTMAVTVLDPTQPDGTRVVSISAFCPTCGTRRGQPRWLHLPVSEHSPQCWVQVWYNPCGHPDPHRQIIAEVESQCAHPGCVLLFSMEHYPFCSGECAHHQEEGEKVRMRIEHWRDVARADMAWLKSRAHAAIHSNDADTDCKSASVSGVTSPTAMTGALLRVLRESLGLTTSWLAQHLDVNERTVYRWENDVMAVSSGVAREMTALVAFTDDFVDSVVAAEPKVLYTYRSGAPAEPVAPGSGMVFPAAWHRAVVARVVARVPGVTVRWLGGSGTPTDSAPRGLR